MILPLPILIALGEYHGWSVLSRIISAIAFGVVLLLLSLNPRGGDVPTEATRAKEPLA
jgi:predicted MFS family arabinose efflux permease